MEDDDDALGGTESGRSAGGKGQRPPAGAGSLPSDLDKLIEAARASGAVKVDGVEGAYLVIPRFGASVAASPFDGAVVLLTPPTSRAAYSDRTAWLMATLSGLAYQPFETDDGRGGLMKVLAAGGLVLDDVIHDKATGTQAFIATREGAFGVLAFRGTEKDRRDVIRDLNARFYDTPDGRAHAGFAAGYEAVHPTIVQALKEIGPERMPQGLFITGHSLGGALATVAAQMLEEDHLVAACYTFGSPRVGTAEWADRVKTPVYRVVNGADSVPMVPLNGLASAVLIWLTNLPFLVWLKGPVDKLVTMGFLGFQHVGDVRFLTGDRTNAHLKMGGAASWARFRHVVVGLLGGAIKTLSPKALSALFADHKISDYAAKLRRIAEERNLP